MEIKLGNSYFPFNTCDDVNNLLTIARLCNNVIKYRPLCNKIIDSDTSKEEDITLYLSSYDKKVVDYIVYENNMGLFSFKKKYKINLYADTLIEDISEALYYDILRITDLPINYKYLGQGIICVFSDRIDNKYKSDRELYDLSIKEDRLSLLYTIQDTCVKLEDKLLRELLVGTSIFLNNRTQLYIPSKYLNITSIVLAKLVREIILLTMTGG